MRCVLICDYAVSYGEHRGFRLSSGEGVRKEGAVVHKVVRRHNNTAVLPLHRAWVGVKRLILHIVELFQIAQCTAYGVPADDVALFYAVGQTAVINVVHNLRSRTQNCEIQNIAAFPVCGICALCHFAYKGGVGVGGGVKRRSGKLRGAVFLRLVTVAAVTAEIVVQDYVCRNGVVISAVRFNHIILVVYKRRCG